MTRRVVLKTTEEVKSLLDEWNKNLTNEKGFRVLKHQSDDMFAQMARLKMFNQTPLKAELITGRGNRPRQVRFKI